MHTRRKFNRQAGEKKARLSKYETETVISIEFSEDRQCQIIYNMESKEAEVFNNGIASVTTRLKQLEVKSQKKEEKMDYYEIPKRWVKIRSSEAKKKDTINAHIVTRMPAVINRLKKKGIEPDYYQADYAIYDCPHTWIKIIKPMALSPEQREKRASAMRKLLEKG